MISLIDEAKTVLTNFNVTNAGDSCYFKMHQFCIRVSNHLAKNSDGDIQFVQQDKKVIIWKCGIKDNNKDVGAFTKIVTLDTALDILKNLNTFAKYFIP